MYVVFIAVPVQAQWVDMRFPASGSVRALASIDSVLFASASEEIVLVTNKNANQWTEPTSSLTGKLVNTFLVHGDDIFAGTASSGLSRSTDKGTTWNVTGLSVGGIYAVSNYDSTIYVSSVSGVYCSYDNGLTWARLNSYKSVKGVLLHNDRLFCVSAEQGLYVSDDSGKIWRSAQNGIPSTTLSTIIKHENDLYIATYGSGVFRSSDNGAEWVSTNTGLSNYDVLAFESINDLILVGTYGGGVFASNTKGKVWSPVNWGAGDYHNYAFAHDDTTVFMATGNSGVFRRPLLQFINLQSVPVPRLSDELQLGCYPNPFSSSSRISYTLAEPDMVSIEVYDILGRKVVALAGDIQGAGQHAVMFDGINLPEGIYYAKLKTSSAQSQIKMILSK